MVTLGGTQADTWPRGFKTVFMLNSTEHEIYPAHKCWNANNFTVSEQYKYNTWEFYSMNNLSFYLLWAIEISCSVELSMKRVL